MPSTQSLKFRRIKKIISYVVFVVVTFSASLLFLPHELFLLSAIVVLVMLRAVEKELNGLNLRTKQNLETQSAVKESSQNLRHSSMSEVTS
jgi:hypothetical protein